MPMLESRLEDEAELWRYLELAEGGAGAGGSGMATPGKYFMRDIIFILHYISPTCHQARAAAVHARAPLEAAHGAGVVRDPGHHKAAGGHPHRGRGVRGHVIREAARKPV